MALAFEHTHKLSEHAYLAIWSSIRKAPRWSRLARILAAAALGILFLFSPYTLVLGIILLLVTIGGSLMPWRFPGTRARTFRQMRYLADPVTYGLNDEGVWLRTTDFQLTAAWRHITVWRESEGWLVLQGTSFAPILFPVERLRSEGLYEAVMQRVREHAVEFDSREARALR